MFTNYSLVTGPTTEPVSLIQLQNQCVVSPGVDSDLLSSYGIAAREFCENYCQRAFFSQQYQLTMDHFPVVQYSGTVNPAMRRDWSYYAGIWQGQTIALPRPKCISVDSITYIDITGTTQTLSSSNYIVDLTSTPARIVPAPGIYWPLNTLYVPGSVVVNYTSGTWTAETIPVSICQAILLLASHWYLNRESTSSVRLNEIPFGVTALLDMYKVRAILDYESIV
jgi:uncharacterized phiE125 gp8 family phage protein